MKKNVGMIDRWVRIVLGVVFLILAATQTIGWWGYIVAALLIVTGVFSFCLLYTACGLNSCKVAPKS